MEIEVDIVKSVKVTIDLPTKDARYLYNALCEALVTDLGEKGLIEHNEDGTIHLKNGNIIDIPR